MNRILTMVLRNLAFVPGAYIKLCKYAKNPEKYSEEEMYNHIRYIMNRGIKSGNIDLQIYGEENIPSESGYMVYGNHQGMFDIMAITAAFKTPMSAVFKWELKNIPFLKQIIACTKAFAMDRNDLRQSMNVIQSVTKEVKNGRNYLIFPEGTRSRKGNTMLEFHAGSFRPAIKAKCTIVPIVFIDSYKVLDEKGSAPVTVQIHVLNPIKYEEFKNMNTNELADFVRSKIEKVIIDNAADIENVSP